MLTPTQSDIIKEEIAEGCPWKAYSKLVVLSDDRVSLTSRQIEKLLIYAHGHKIPVAVPDPGLREKVKGESARMSGIEHYNNACDCLTFVFQYVIKSTKQ